MDNSYFNIYLTFIYSTHAYFPWEIKNKDDENTFGRKRMAFH